MLPPHIGVMKGIQVHDVLRFLRVPPAHAAHPSARLHDNPADGNQKQLVP